MLIRSCLFNSVFALFLVLTPTARAAAPLADHVPDNAIAYVGWAGADALGPAYQASDLSAFIDHSNLPDLASKYVPMLWDRFNLRFGDKQAAEAAATLRKIQPLLWRHPVAIYESNLAPDPDGPQTFRNPLNFNLTMICDAGADAAELQADIQSLIKTNPRVRVVSHDGVVTLGLAKLVEQPLGSTLAGNPQFLAAMQKLQPSPAFAVYVDAKTLLAKADESAQKDEEAAEVWPKVRDALGIAGVKTFAMTAGFDTGNWMTASLLEAPSPRTGLLAAIEPKPIDPALLARIPASAGSVSVYNLDLAKLVDTIGDAMATSPQSDQAFHQANGLATVALGANFRKQILGPLGPQWVLYSDSVLHSMVLMNHPTDPAMAGDSMVSAIFGLTNLANAQIPGAATQPVVNAVQAKLKQVDVTSAVTKFASPSVAVKDGILYFGLTPESVVSSATLPANPPATDLLHNESFLAAVKRLGVPSFSSFVYCDLPNTAPRAYDNFAPAGAQLRQVMALAGLDIPKIELPPLEQLKMHLSPALSVTWADADGVYSKSISPFPLATQLLGDPQQTMISATTVSALSAMITPALQRARATAMTTQMMSSERQIVMGLAMYAADHHGQYPADLGTLVSEGQLQGSGLSLFLKPTSTVQVPPEILNGSKEQQAKWVNENAEYVFLTPNRKTSEDGASETPVIVPKDAVHSTTRVAVGFADGHVETCTPKHVQHLLHPDDQ